MSESFPRSVGLLGQSAVDRGWITHSQLLRAVEEQSVLPERTPLGELLVAKGWLKPEQLGALLQEQRERKESAAASGSYSSAAASVRREVQKLPAGRTKYEIDQLLAKAVSAGTGDFHVHSGAPMFARINGELRPASSSPTGAERAQQLLEPILTQRQKQILRSKGEVEFAYDLGGVGRFRASIFRQHHGLSAVFRHVASEPPTLVDLGLPTDLTRFVNFFQGIVMVTGPAGSGKSSTLAALVDLINHERAEHIVCIEDPVEFVYESKRSTVNQRQVDRHTESYATALRGALREDPDVIVIGELRDEESIGLALTAAETGHLVLATMTTTNAVRTIERLIGVFPPRRQNQVRAMVSESLRGIISQRLIPRKDGRGRVVALELLMLDHAVSNLIRDEKTVQIESVLQTGGSKGQRLMDVSLEQLLKEGVITRAEAEHAADDPARFEVPTIAHAEWAKKKKWLS